MAIIHLCIFVYVLLNVLGIGIALALDGCKNSIDQYQIYTSISKVYNECDLHIDRTVYYYWAFM